MTAAAPAIRKTRFDALDAMRGLAILAMILSSEMPFGEKSLPAWMYHAQVPPPHHEFIPNPGITWVDLVFPFFLFSMGAAFPLALRPRLGRGESEGSIVLNILRRGFLLGFFALFVMAIRPGVLSENPTASTWFKALVGFAILFPVLCRLPESWSKVRQTTVRTVGWIAAILFLALARYPDGSGFSLERSDIIIVVLTNVAVFGGLIWMATRENILARMGVIGLVLAFRMSNMPAELGGWVTDVWGFSPVKWIYKLYYLQYLCIVLPGTVAGDLVWNWLHAPKSDVKRRWSSTRMVAIAALMFGFILVLLIGLKSRWLVPTVISVLVLMVTGWLLVRRPQSDIEKLYRTLFCWAVYWMALGLILESYEGGIRKDKATVSYYFVTCGLANCLVICLSIVINIFEKGRWLRLFSLTGQNPMIAYAGVNNLIAPILTLTGLLALLDKWASTPWRGFWEGVLITLMMALVAAACSRAKLFWRT